MYLSYLKSQHKLGLSKVNHATNLQFHRLCHIVSELKVIFTPHIQPHLMFKDKESIHADYIQQLNVYWKCLSLCLVLDKMGHNPLCLDLGPDRWCPTSWCPSLKARIPIHIYDFIGQSRYIPRFSPVWTS